MAEQKKSGASIASMNLKNAWASPVTKIGVAVFVLLAIMAGGVGIAMIRSGGSKAGPAEGSGYSASGNEPRGAADLKTVKAVEVKLDESSRVAMDDGRSFGGPFVFEGGVSAASGGGGGGFDESSLAGPSRQPSAVLADMRQKASEYDSSEESGSGSARTSPSSGNRGSNTQSGQQGYGLTPEAFTQIAGQLSAVGVGQIRYDSVVGGVLTRPPQQIVAEQGGTKGPAVPTQLTAKQQELNELKEVVAARAGDICGAAAESSINTDYSVPVFFELLDCGPLTGARARGVVQKTPDDFSIKFANFTLDPKKGYKLATPVEGQSVSVKNDGSAGVADDVNNHWVTRLASSGLLSLARMERNFIAARGSSTINTGTSTSVTVDPLSSEEKRAARVAGLLEGSMDVVARDLSYGVNRPATMTMDKSTVIGIQFLSDVKVTSNE